MRTAQKKLICLMLATAMALSFASALAAPLPAGPGPVVIQPQPPVAEPAEGTFTGRNIVVISVRARIQDLQYVADEYGPMNVVNYAAAQDGDYVVITLSNNYVASLAPGNYNFDVVFTNGAAIYTLHVPYAAPVPTPVPVVMAPGPAVDEFEPSIGKLIKTVKAYSDADGSTIATLRKGTEVTVLGLQDGDAYIRVSGIEGMVDGGAIEVTFQQDVTGETVGPTNTYRNRRVKSSERVLYFKKAGTPITISGFYGGWYHGTYRLKGSRRVFYVQAKDIKLDVAWSAD